MYTMQYDIAIGKYRLGMLDKVEIHRSVELLADTAKIVLPGSEYNVALDVEQQLRRGDRVSIRLGYKETGMQTEFEGYLQRISTDDGSIVLECEDDLFLFRKTLPNAVLKQISLKDLLNQVIAGIGLDISVECSYEWTYSRFVINQATGFDVLKKVQEECGADIYLQQAVLHVHPPGEKVGDERLYDFAYNIEKSDLTYRRYDDKKVLVVVKSLMPDGTVKEVEVGATGGDRVEIKCPASDDTSMKLRGAAELKRRSFDGYDGSITTWLVPYCIPGDSATVRDQDYPEKEGKYYVRSVTTEFGPSGGSRVIALGFRLS